MDDLIWGEGNTVAAAGRRKIMNSLAWDYGNPSLSSDSKDERKVCLRHRKLSISRYRFGDGKYTKPGKGTRDQPSPKFSSEDERFWPIDNQTALQDMLDTAR